MRLLVVRAVVGLRRSAKAAHHELVSSSVVDHVLQPNNANLPKNMTSFKSFPFPLAHFVVPVGISIGISCTEARHGPQRDRTQEQHDIRSLRQRCCPIAVQVHCTNVLQTLARGILTAGRPPETQTTASTLRNKQKELGWFAWLTLATLTLTTLEPRPKLESRGSGLDGLDGVGSSLDSLDLRVTSSNPSPATAAAAQGRWCQKEAQLSTAETGASSSLRTAQQTAKHNERLPGSPESLTGLR